MLEEQKLVHQIHAGDKLAEDKFRSLFRPRLHRASLRLLDDDELEATAAVNDTFSLAMHKLRGFNFAVPVALLMSRVCTHCCYVRLRSRGKLLAIHENDTDRYLRLVLLERLQGIESWQHGGLKIKIIEELKNKLSGESRRILDMRDRQGFSFAQIGHSLGIAQGAAMTRLFNAREKLRHLIENMAPDSLARMIGDQPSLALSLGISSLETN